MRASIGMIALEFPTNYASDAQDYLAKGLAMRDQWKGKTNLSFCLAPHAPYTVADATFERIGVLAEKAGRADPSPRSRNARRSGNSTPAKRGAARSARLASLGLLSPRLIAVHAVHLESAEISVLANHGCHVSHCPSSNLKLASGIAPVAAIARRRNQRCLGHRWSSEQQSPRHVRRDASRCVAGKGYCQSRRCRPRPSSTRTRHLRRRPRTGT
jgi:5-methylthioadenosine/S-adenosylhomocysteine deaminase